MSREGERHAAGCAAPRRIVSLSCIESTAAGPTWTSAAIDWSLTLRVGVSTMQRCHPIGATQRVSADSVGLRGGRLSQRQLHPRGDRCRRGLFCWVQRARHVRTQLVGVRGVAPARRSPGANGALVSRSGRRLQPRPCDRGGRALRVGLQVRRRLRAGRAHSASRDRVRRTTCEAGVRRIPFFVHRDAKGPGEPFTHAEGGQRGCTASRLLASPRQRSLLDLNFLALVAGCWLLL